MSDLELAGRVALVTGSSRGIGFAIAERLAESGAAVVMNGRDPGALHDAADRLRARGHVVEALAADVGEPAEVERLFRSLLEVRGRIDILVNNAAQANPLGHILEMSVDRWNDILRSNLHSVFLCTRLAADDMVRSRTAGTVINISSWGAFRSHRNLVAYDTAKGGIEAFTRSVALDLAPFAIRVNAVAPGPIQTEGMGPGDDDDARRRGSIIPLGRIGMPGDVADAVAFLASDRARFITGQTVIVDGGALAQLRPASVDTKTWTIQDVEARPRLLQPGPQEGES